MAFDTPATRSTTTDIGAANVQHIARMPGITKKTKPKSMRKARTKLTSRSVRHRHAVNATYAGVAAPSPSVCVNRSMSYASVRMRRSK